MKNTKINTEMDLSAQRKISSSFTNPQTKNHTAAATAIKTLRNKVTELEQLNLNIKSENKSLHEELKKKQQEFKQITSTIRK